MRRFAFLLLFILGINPSHANGVSSASSVALKIRQINPAGEIFQITCSDKQQKCVLPIQLQTSQMSHNDLAVTVLTGKGHFLLEFHTSDGYLYAVTKDEANASYRTVWSTATDPLALNQPTTENITLFLPGVPNAFLAPILNVGSEAAAKNSHQPVADLEITAEMTP